MFQESNVRVIFNLSILMFIIILIGVYIAENKKSLFLQQVAYATHIDSMQKEGNSTIDEKKKVITLESNKKKRVVNEKERKALYKIVEAEASSEDIIGKIMVANVIFNRVDSDRFPNNVFDVIHQRINGKAQFSPINDNRYYTVEVSAQTKEAVERTIAGETYAEDALFFMARSMASKNSINWFDNELTLIKKHGIHEFFKY